MQALTRQARGCTRADAFKHQAAVAVCLGDRGCVLLRKGRAFIAEPMADEVTRDGWRPAGATAIGRRGPDAQPARPCLL